jgi:hypothetical protein
MRAVIENAGPARGPSSEVPACGGTLSDEEVADIVAHVRGICAP